MNFKVNKIDNKLFAKTACLNNEKLCFYAVTFSDLDWWSRWFKVRN